MLLLAGSAAAQIPAALYERLTHKESMVRRTAVEQLGRLGPSPQITAAELASLLTSALKDKEIVVRYAAASSLRGDRPADIVVPALLQALAGVEKDVDSLRDVIAKLEEKEPGGGVTIAPTGGAYVVDRSYELLGDRS
jgi:hypothetical protein